MTNHKWIHANPDIILEVYSENKDFIDDVSNHLWACDVVAPALNQIVHWITVRAKQGYKLICIDPITAATMRTGRQWEEEKVFLQQVDKIGRQYGCSFLFVTHPQKQTNMAPNMQYLAGSANYSRFADTILWLEGHQEKTGNIKTFMGTDEDVYNRTIHLLKSRNAKGQGLRLAYKFDSETLNISELGIIIKKEKK